MVPNDGAGKHVRHGIPYRRNALAIYRPQSADELLQLLLAILVLDDAAPPIRPYRHTDRDVLPITHPEAPSFRGEVQSHQRGLGVFVVEAERSGKAVDHARRQLKASDREGGDVPLCEVESTQGSEMHEVGVVRRLPSRLKCQPNTSRCSDQHPAVRMQPADDRDRPPDTREQPCCVTQLSISRPQISDHRSRAVRPVADRDRAKIKEVRGHEPARDRCCACVFHKNAGPLPLLVPATHASCRIHPRRSW